MLPWPLLAGLILAFGLGDLSGTSALDFSSVWHRVALWMVGLAGFAALAIGSGWFSARQFSRLYEGLPVRRFTLWLGRVLEVLALALFGWAMLGLEWPRIVAWNLGARNTILVDDILIIAPFLIELLVLWSAEYPIERLLRHGGTRSGFWPYLRLRIRQTAGLLLPLLLIYGLGQDLLVRAFPDYRESSAGQLGMLAVVATCIMLASPVFVRLSCPTRRLEDGPLRDRLERLARRSGFPCRDILVWETGGSLLNAGITGALPFFRYVLLTDALIQRLDAAEIEAVFGHEIGHVKHRHLVFFGLFFVGSVGLLSLVDVGLQSLTGVLPMVPQTWLGVSLGEILEWGVALAVLGTYFFFVFGFLSRRFERQADVFGCRAVSCTSGECPPHLDPNCPIAQEEAPRSVCPSGVRIFAQALSSVAFFNGMSVQAPSWRHGSIADRIAFVEKLENHPESLRHFDRHILRLRLTLLVLLVLGTLASLLLHDGSVLAF